MPVPLSLYVHIPFCLRKCRYCDFASGPADPSLVAPYVEAVCREMEMRQHEAPEAVAETLYFGGGTPSLLEPAQVESIVDRARRLYALAEDAEITLEANPGTVDRDRLAAFREAGINRLSLGVQSFDDEQLAFLGRIHSAAETRAAFEAARQAGFDNIGMDLIHTLPGQTEADWRRQLQEAVSLSPEHISAYGLTLEDGTPLTSEYEAGRFSLPDNDEAGRLYLLTAEFLTAAGYEQYEIANFSRPGRRSRHNQAYWHWLPYLGFGAAAHSFNPSPFPGLRRHNHDDLQTYLDAMGKGILPEAEKTPLTRDEAMGEWLFLALRTTDGFLPEEFSATFGLPVTEVCESAIPRLLGEGLLISKNGRIRLAPSAFAIANQVFLHFV